MVRFGWQLIGLALVAALVSCGGDETPAPDSVTPPVSQTGGATAVTLLELATDPAAYEGKIVRVTGRFSPIPRPECGAMLHLSPAGWLLGDQGVALRAAGLEHALWSLATEGLQLTVDGRLVSWQGLIGCGSLAVESTVFYLEADRLVAPNPISRATLTPMGFVATPTPMVATIMPLTATPPAGISPTSSVVQPSPTNPGGLSPLATPSAPPGTATPNVTETPRPTDPFSPLPTLSPPPSPTLAPSGTVYPTFTPLASASPTGTPAETATPSPSPDGHTPALTPTFTPSPTGTHTPTPESGNTVDQGEAILDRVHSGSLGEDEVHRWVYDGSLGQLITIAIGPDASLDLSFILQLPSGTDLFKRDDGLAGGEERVEDYELTEEGQYGILVSDVSGRAGDYALLVSDEYSIPVHFPGNLVFGQTVGGSVPEDARDIWHFYGTAGQTVSILVTPTDEGDMLFNLFGPGDLISPIDEVDLGYEGEEEAWTGQLQATGMYSIRVEEWYGAAANYDILVALQ